MSYRNKADQKMLRRADRGKHAQDTKGCMPYLGYIVRKADVLTQRYLRDHGLPCSTNVAGVTLPKDTFTLRNILRGATFTRARAAA